jgi:transcriptional regulator with XRE-family HTH domain
MTDGVTRLSVLRRLRLWSQAELAKRAGVAASTVSHIENGKAPHLRPSVIRKLARVLGIKDPLTVREFRDAILRGEDRPVDDPLISSCRDGH